MTEPRVIVVGAGIAGLAAALAASRAGVAVTVIDGGSGASVLAGGAWDVATELGAWREPRDLEVALRRVAQRAPSHPWARLPREVLREAIPASHAAVLEALGIYRPLGASPDALLVASDLGLVRRAATSQRAVLDLAALPRANVAVASIRSMRAFDARFIAASLTEQATRAGDARRYVAVDVELFRRASDVELLPSEAAALLDAQDARDRAIVALTRALGGTSFDAVLVPPVLGRDDDRVGEIVSSAVGAPVGEMIESLAGVQSLRLARRIEAALEGAPRVERVVERAVRVEAREVELASGAIHRAPSVVLATGKHLGGGVVSASHDVREPLARIPLWSNDRPLPLASSARGRDPRALYGDDPFAPGAGFALGAGWDATLRAKDDHGDVLDPGLFVAGGLLDGVRAGDGTGFGAACVTGWLAGTHAARFAAG